MLTVVVVALGAFAACSGSSAGERSSLACDHFRNVSRDAGAGILSQPELRDKLKEVNSSASGAPADVRSAAQRLLAAITRDDTTAFSSAATDMDKACAAHGH